MKNTHRILAIMLTLFLTIPLFGVGAKADAASLDTVYLVQPIDIYVDNGSIYVADIINDGQNTVIHQITSDLTTRKSYYVNGITQKIYVDGINLFAMQKDKILFLGIDEEAGNIAVGMTINAPNVKDFVVCEKLIYLLTDKDLIQYDFTTRKYKTIYPNMTDTRSISMINNRLCVIYGNTYMTYTDEDGYSTPVTLSNDCDKVFGISETPAFYNSSKICLTDGTALLNPENGIKDLFFYGNLLIVLGNDKRIRQYSYQNNTFSVVENFIIGDDKVSATVPTEFTGFTLARATKYPTNIMYQASQSPNPAPYKLLSDDDAFIILSYAGMEQSKYYYVFYKGGFGWLEKGSTEITTDNLILTNTSYGFVGQALTTTYVYSLPYYDNEGSYVIENVPKDTAFKISDRYENLTDSNAEWFYVSYEVGNKTKRGFVRQSLVTNLTLNPETKIKRYTVNTDLTNQLPLFKNADLTENVLDQNGKPIMITSGKQVSVIAMDEASAFVQVDIDGAKYTGYLDSTRLIEDGLTNYVALGLILGIIVILGVVFFVIMAKRHKKHAVTPDDMDPFEAAKFDYQPKDKNLKSNSNTDEE